MTRTALRILLAALFLSAWQLAQTVTQVGDSSVWRPSAHAVQVLKAASAAGKMGADQLAQIMWANGASSQAIAFTRERGGSGEYLANRYGEREIRSGKSWRDLMAVGRVEFPLGGTRPMTFLVFRDGLPPLDVADPKLLSHCDISTAMEFGTLGFDKSVLTPQWNAPFDWTDQYPEGDGVEIVVEYPIKAIARSAPVGYVDIRFTFNLRGVLQSVRPQHIIAPNDVQPLHRGN